MRRFLLPLSLFLSVALLLAACGSDSAEDLVNRGDRLLGEGKPAEAIESFSRAIEKDPEMALAYYLRGVARSFLAQYEVAITDMNRAIDLAPEEVIYVGGRGLTYWLVGDNQRAIDDFDRVLAIDAEDTEALNLRALARIAIGDYEAALTDVNRALELDDDEDGALLDTRAYAYLKAGRFAESKADYDALLARGIDDVYSLLGAGLAYRGVGEIEAGNEFLRRGLAIEVAPAEMDPQLDDLISRAMAAPTPTDTPRG